MEALILTWQFVVLSWESLLQLDAAVIYLSHFLNQKNFLWTAALESLGWFTSMCGIAGVFSTSAREDSSDARQMISKNEFFVAPTLRDSTRRAPFTEECAV